MMMMLIIINRYVVLLTTWNTSPLFGLVLSSPVACLFSLFHYTYKKNDDVINFNLYSHFVSCLSEEILLFIVLFVHKLHTVLLS